MLARASEGREAMRALASILAAAFCLLVVSYPGAGRAQDMSEVFGLRVCNNSNRTVSLALSTTISPSDKRYHVFGWYTLYPGCTDMGYYPRPWLYYYAEEYNKRRTYKIWQGEFPLCVAHPGPFDWVHTSGMSCPPSELKLFTEVRVDPDTGIFVVNLQQ